MSEYIGDGVYADMENNMVKLSTEREGGIVHVIYLERPVYDALVQYARRAWRLEEEEDDPA